MHAAPDVDEVFFAGFDFAEHAGFDQNVAHYFVDADNPHVFAFNFFDQGTENAVITQRFGPDFGKKGGGSHVGDQFFEAGTADGADHHHFFHLFVAEAFEAAAGLADADPHMRNVFGKKGRIGVAFNGNNKEVAAGFPAMFNQTPGKRSSPGDDSQLFVFGFHQASAVMILRRPFKASSINSTISMIRASSLYFSCALARRLSKLPSADLKIYM